VSPTKHACIAGCEPHYQKIIRSQLHDYSYKIGAFFPTPIPCYDDVNLVIIDSNRLDDARKAAIQNLLLHNREAVIIFIGPPFRMDDFKLKSHKGRIFQLEKGNTFLQDFQDMLDQVTLPAPRAGWSLLQEIRRRVFRLYGIDPLQLSH
jgi:hypothetical protein